MSITKAGIRRIAIWDKTNAEASIIALSLRNGGKLTIMDKEDIQDYRGRPMPDMVNFKIVATSYDIGRPLLYYLLVHAQADGVSAELLSRKTASTPTYDGIFSFVGDNYLGLDFEYIISQKERSAALTLEATFEQDVAKAIINDAVTNNTPNSLSGFNEVDFLAANYRPAYFSFAKYGDTDTVLYSKDEIISRKLTIRTKGSKTAYDRTIINVLEVMYEVELVKSSKTDIKAFHDITPFAPKLTLQEVDPSGKFEKHLFEEGVLALTRESNIGDDSRTIKLKFKGDVPMDAVSGAESSGSYTYTYTL